MTNLVFNVLRVIVAAAVVVIVAQVSHRFPRAGAVLLSLPLISMLAFTASWLQYRDMRTVGQMARETLVLVPLGLPFFVPFAFAQRLGLSYWSSFLSGTVLVTVSIGAYLALFPKG